MYFSITVGGKCNFLDVLIFPSREWKNQFLYSFWNSVRYCNFINKLFPYSTATSNCLVQKKKEKIRENITFSGPVIG
jgi:hypothetical protein